MRRQRSAGPKAETRRGVKKPLSDQKKDRIVLEVESSNQEKLSDNNGADSHVGDYRDEVIGDECEDVKVQHLIELAFGEMSFPERSYEDSLHIRSKYAREEQNGHCSTCSCHKGEDREVVAAPKRVEATSPSLEDSDLALSPTSLVPFEKPEESVDTSVVFDEISEKRSASSSSASSSSQTSTGSTISEEDAESVAESAPAEESKAATVEDAEAKSSLHFSKPRHMSMWYMIHQHMSSNVAAESTNKQVQEDEDATPSSNELSETDIGSEATNESETQEIELRKLFAVKLVREAIERILLPEVQDQSSDDQSTPRGTEIKCYTTIQIDFSNKLHNFYVFCSMQ